MRQDSPAFRKDNFALRKEPRFFFRVSFDDTDSDVIYLTSHADVPVPSGSKVIQNCIMDASVISQRLNASDGVSEIGSIGFTVVDREGLLTTEIFEQLQDDRGLRHKNVAYFSGYAHYTEPEQFRLAQVQMVRSVVQNGDSYTFNCSDVQRFLKDTIFRNMAETRLTASVGHADLLIPAQIVSRFQTVSHGPSFSDAPNRSVFYVKMEEEYVRCSGVTLDAEVNGEPIGPALVVDSYVVDGRTFTGRGALGSLPAPHVVPEGVNARPVQIREVVYLEMPAVKLAIALMTGLNGWLPDHWHLGMSNDYLRLSEWQGIGLDWWDPNNDAAGLQMRFVDFRDEEGKHFIETEIMRFLEAFMIVHNDGSLGLRRAGGVLPGASPLYEVDERHVNGHSALTHEMEAVRNIVTIDWGWDHFTQNFLNSTPLVDLGSMIRHKVAPAKRLAFRGVHSSHYTRALLENAFSRMRDRFAGPPLKIRTNLTSGYDELEVGDVVRLNLPSVLDFTTGQPLLRSMEVQATRTNPMTGDVMVDWMGSSDEAGPPLQLEDESGIALSDTFYTSQGSALTSVGLNTEFVGSTLRILGGTITGGDTMASGASIFYYDGDVEIPANAVLTIVKNVQLRIAGHLQLTGLIDGKGNSGESGAFANFGVTIAGGRVEYLHYGRLGGGTKIVSERGDTVDAEFTSVPRLEVSVDEDGVLHDFMLEDQRGTNGAVGEPSRLLQIGNYSGITPEDLTAPGGARGRGGAGLAIICRGLSHPPGGRIDLSGSDGEPGTVVKLQNFPGNDWRVAGGSGGGGHPGACYIYIDGTAFAVPNTNTLMLTQMGDCPIPSGAFDVFQAEAPDYEGTRNGSVVLPDGRRTFNFCAYSHYWGYVNHDGGSHHRASTRMQMLFGHQSPSPERPRNADLIVGMTVTRMPNHPRTADGAYVTARVRMVPSDDTDDQFQPLLSHGRVFWRRAGADVWHEGAPVTKTGYTDIQFLNDGEAYNISVRPVTVYNVTAPGGPLSFFRTDNVVSPQLDEKPSDVLLVPNVTGLELKGQGNNAEFGGREAKFAWRSTSYYDWVEFGSEPPGLGAGAGALDQYFRDYVVQVYSKEGEKLREHSTSVPEFTYTYEMNAEDGGPRREFRVDVYMRSRQNQLSRRPARLYVTNTPSPLPSAVSFAPGFQLIAMRWSEPTDLDFKDVVVWASTVSGFTPGPGNVVYTGIESPLRVSGLSSDTVYYIRFAARDAFSKRDGTADGLVLSAEHSIRTDKLAADLEGLSAWATRLDPVDEAFIQDTLLDDAMPSEKIKNLAVGKLTTGTLIATVDIQSQGAIRARSASYDVIMGATEVAGSVALLHSTGPSGLVFAMYEDGGAQFTGEILGSLIEGGQVIGSLIKTSDAGTRLEMSSGGLFGYDDFNDEWLRIRRYEISDTINYETVLGHIDGVFLRITNFTEPEESAVSSGVVEIENRYSGFGAALWVTAAHVQADAITARGGRHSITAFGGTTGIRAFADNTSVTAYGGFFQRTGSGNGAALRIAPIGATGAPTFSAEKGALVVNGDGKLYINTTPSGLGSTWQLVGGQT